jgi:phenylalanyl-tRNA synthetase alpha chain
VLSATAYQQLPAAAIGRLGAKPGQKNLLMRPIPSIWTNTHNQTATALPDRSYRALHQGRNTNGPDDPRQRPTA